MTVRLKKAADWMQAKFSGEDKTISGIATDTRLLAENELFFALAGARVNGHDLIQEAERKGAAGVVVSQTVNTKLPTLVVQDTVLALGKLSQAYRKQFDLPMAAITGSYGKTTVKEMLASILAAEGPMLATKGNLNTEIGVPLTLMQLTSEHRNAVIEMGARKPGDIRRLMEIASPTVALVNNAGIAHIEVFGSEQDVRNTKGELYAGLKPEGIAVINLDDPHVEYWKSLLHGQKIFTFGNTPSAELSLSAVKATQQGSQFTLNYQANHIPITLQAAGDHNIRNSLAAAATAFAMGVSMQAVQQGLTAFKSVTGRLQFKTGCLNCRIIDDTYNANPVSMRAALDVLAKQSGEKIFVMADMLELGEHAETWHREMGAEAKRLGIDKMYGFGKLTRNAILEFGTNAKYYEDKSLLIHDLKQILNKDVTILVKGSRGMRMEEVVIALQNSETMDVMEKPIC